MPERLISICMISRACEFIVFPLVIHWGNSETNINYLKRLDKAVTFCYLPILVEYFSNTSSIDLVFLDQSCF